MDNNTVVHDKECIRMDSKETHQNIRGTCMVPRLKSLEIERAINNVK